MLEGIIVKNISNSYTVLCNQTKYVCTPRGLFRKQKITPFVGDKVRIDEKNSSIIEILPRKNELLRPSVVNVDIALIVTSLVEPDLSTLLLDKEITSIILSNVQPVICFTKLDLASKAILKEYQILKKYYESIGIPVFDNEHLKPLLSYLKHSFVVLTGQSGAGKSTLLNRMDENLNLETNAISEALNRGKHTTRHTEIYEIQDIYFCDTPGFSSLSFDKYSLEEIKESFTEFNEYPCKFRDCSHQKEIGCGVKQAVEDGNILPSRYENYQKIVLERRK